MRLVLAGRLLLIEDASSTKSALYTSLQRAGEVIRARSVLEALAQYSKLDPDIVVTECLVGGVEHVEIIKDLRASGCDAPVIIVARDVSAPNVVKMMRAGANDVLPRRVDETTLLAAVRDAQDYAKRSGAPARSRPSADQPSEQRSYRISAGSTLREMENELIDATLKFCDNSIPTAARMLGISASTLYRKLDQRRN